jgi:hypothetical protein
MAWSMESKVVKKSDFTSIISSPIFFQWSQFIEKTALSDTHLGCKDPLEQDCPQSFVGSTLDATGKIFVPEVIVDPKNWTTKFDIFAISGSSFGGLDGSEAQAD